MNQVTVVILDVVQKSKEIVISFFFFFSNVYNLTLLPTLLPWRCASYPSDCSR